MFARINSHMASHQAGARARVLRVDSQQRLAPSLVARRHSHPDVSAAATPAEVEAAAKEAGEGCPFEVDAVVVGGGVVGCAALYRLARAGLRALLLERHQLTAGARRSLANCDAPHCSLFTW